MGMFAAHFLFHTVADVLVGHQLPSNCSGNEFAHIQPLEVT
jgi:hypothetical protein